MRDQDVFIGADKAFVAVARQISGEQWELPVLPVQPPGSDPRSIWGTVNAVTYEDAWVQPMLSGQTVTAFEADPWAGDLLLLHEDPHVAVSEMADRACAAAAGFADDDLGRTVHCSFGDFPAREYLWQTTSFHALVAWDLAQLLGFANPLSDELVEALLAQLDPVADEWREWGVFPPRIPVPDDASALDRLLGATGRPLVGR
ncbi:MAG: TIGR03086 family protein [Geodermatophilaceae bacterium]|nr:TIGR03086 family protein [Geodermatophilaceae bacterium]